MTKREREVKRKRGIVIAVLGAAIIAAFPLSLLVNKLNHTNDTTDHVAAQQDQITRQQNQISAILVQLTAVSNQNRRLTCTFGSFTLAQPIAQLVNESDAEFAQRLRTYKRILTIVRRRGECNAALGPIFHRRLEQRIARINHAINALPLAARHGTGTIGGAGNSHGRPPPGKSNPPTTTAPPQTNENPGPGNSGGTGGSGGGNGVGQGLNDILKGVGNGVGNTVDGVGKGLNDILNPPQEGHP
jgi:uncharacterized membrane protein YgcG